ncbi:MAG: hypothetical protein JPMHGGIA_02263 [Saprospiraceae bacterium]|nr:hypothetical protein [Saprospiraceae bacterium]
MTFILVTRYKSKDQLYINSFHILSIEPFKGNQNSTIITFINNESIHVEESSFEVKTLSSKYEALQIVK